MAIEDLQEARRAKKKKEEVAKAEKKLEKAEAKVEKAEEKVKEAKKEVNEAEEKVKAQQEKAIRCTASVWSQFSRKMQKIDESYFAYLHILWFKQFCFFSEYPQ
jgi:peptidoglycan hydrolase CwlO-like protein